MILALGLNIVVGFAGLLDLGYVAFFAIGAYAWGIIGSTQLTNVLNIAPINPHLVVSALLADGNCGRPGSSAIWCAAWRADAATARRLPGNSDPGLWGDCANCLSGTG